MKHLTLLVTLAMSLSAWASGSPLCDAEMAADPYFHLAVEAHKHDALKIADLEHIIKQPEVFDPLANEYDLFSILAFKKAFAVLIKDEHVAKLWPETVRKLADYVQKAASAEAQAQETRARTQRMLSPHLVRSFGSEDIQPAFIKDETGQILVAHIVGGTSLQVHSLSADGLIFEAPLPQGTAPFVAGWHKDANGKITLHLAWQASLPEDSMGNKSTVGFKVWDWKKRHTEPGWKKITDQPMPDIVGLRWINVSGNKLILMVQSDELKFHNIQGNEAHELKMSRLPGQQLAYRDQDHFYYPSGLEFKSLPIGDNVLLQPKQKQLVTHDGKLAEIYLSKTPPMSFHLTGKDGVYSQNLGIEPDSYIAASLFETEDHRILVAFYVNEKNQQKIRVFEPMKGPQEIYSQPVEVPSQSVALKWFTGVYKEPLLGVIHHFGSTCEIINPFEQRSEMKFAVGQKSNWLESDGKVYYWNLQGGKTMKIYKVMADGEASP